MLSYDISNILIIRHEEYFVSFILKYHHVIIFIYKEEIFWIAAGYLIQNINKRIYIAL